jgi:hypothetical protein
VALMTGHSKFGSELAELLGLKQCRALELRVSVDSAVTVKAECYVTTEQGERIVELLRTYDIVERPVKSGSPYL